MTTRPTSHLLGRIKLVSLFVIPALILVMIAASAGATPATPSRPAFATVHLPNSAMRITPDMVKPQRSSRNPKLDTAMARTADAAKQTPAQALGVAQEQALRVAGQRVLVQAVTRAATLDAAMKAIGAAGGEVTGVADEGRLIQGWLPVGAIASVAAQPSIDYIRRPAEVQLFDTIQVGGSTSEGVAAMNAQAWQTAGYRGAGVKIGIIDGGFQGYPTLLGTDLPASVTVKNFVDGETDPQVNGGGVHGTACAEVIHDVAPNAQLFLAKIGTNVDLAEAVAWLKDTQHVNIISTSLGWYNLTPGDGTGEFANLVSQARAAGILWATAASNDREAHWGGPFTDTDNDKYHDFAQTGSGPQEVDYFGPGDGSAYVIPAGYAFRVFLRWDDWASHNQDYDLYLFRWNGSAWVQIASSEDLQDGSSGQTPTEYAFAATSGSDAPYGFLIYRYNSTRNVNFEVFAPKVDRLDELTHARSLANLADAPDAVTVAALDVTSPYPQESYSSEGPTNGAGGTAAGGANKPDISGFANVSTESYKPDLPYKFNGTSSATPHVAGAAALVKGAFPSYTPTQIENFLEGRAVDMGAAGLDTVFGYGRLNLGAAPSGSVTPTTTATPGNKKLYLPYISKAIPPTATPTAIPATGPTPGFWESNTGDEFYVTSDRANVDDFAVYITVNGCGDYKITHTALAPITSSHFSFSGSFYASGTFTSNTAANGTDGLTNFNIGGCGTVNGGPWNWNATWHSSAQPTFLHATVVGPERVDPAPAGDNYYTVTRIN